MGGSDPNSLASPDIRVMPLAALKPAPYNPRRIDDASMSALTKSLERFGVVEPIIWNERTGYIVGGHQRAKVLRAKKVEQAAVVVVDLDDTEERALNVALNSPHLSGQFTDELQALLDEIKAQEPALFDALAFENLQVGRSLFEMRKEEARRTLQARFGAPPFSVLDARQGYWQERKRAWLALGIDSEIGRGENLMKYSAQAQKSGPKRRMEGRIVDVGAYAGGDAMPISTSVFDPVLCELAYRWFCPERGEVLDPFAGGSVRGLVAGFIGQAYHGVDLRPEQVAANRTQVEAIAPKVAPQWYVGDSSDLSAVLPEELRCDFVFSCPPYGPLEKYSDDPRDLSNMEPSAFRGVYRAIVAQACARLRDDRFACFVVGDYRIGDPLSNFVSETIDAFLAAGLVLYNEAILVTAVGSNALRAARMFEPSRKLCKSHQNVLVFLKGDARKATQACTGAHTEFGDAAAAALESEEAVLDG
jgi:hypothetical protein